MKKKSFWIRIILSVGLFALLFSGVDRDEIAELIANCNPLYLGLAYLIALGDRLMMAYKWTILLAVKNIRISLVEATSIYLKTSFLGLFLPATVGGDALRAYAVARAQHNADDAISSIFVERVLGFVALFIFAALGIIASILVMGETFLASLGPIFLLFLVFVVVFFVLIFASLNDTVMGFMRRFLKHWNTNLTRNRYFQKLDDVYRSYRAYEKNKLELGIFLFLSVLENLFPLFWTYALALAFDINIPLLYFFVLVPIVLVLVRLPISLAGIGIREGAYVYLLQFVNVSSSQALLLGAASNILAIGSILLGGILFGLHGFDMQQGSVPEPTTPEEAPTPIESDDAHKTQQENNLRIEG
jgi:glycosyltransferase 2 family protein